MDTRTALRHALDAWYKAVDGDSNDAEYAAAVELAEAAERLLAESSDPPSAVLDAMLDATE